LWNFTPERSLNSHCVSLRAFQEVASDGSYSSLAFRCRRESNMLMLTRMPLRWKCMWGSSVGPWATSATTSVSFDWADAGGDDPTSTSRVRTTASHIGTERFIASPPCEAVREPGPR